MTDTRIRVAIVTGASAGIGLATARQMADGGMQVALVARRGELLKEILADWPEDVAARCLAVSADVTSNDDLDRIVREVEAWAGPADVLVQSAGGSRALPVYATDEMWEEAMELNFHSIRRLAQRVLPGMIERGWGRVIAVTGGSEPNLIPIRPPGAGRSWINGASAAKAALHIWAKGLSREVGATGVTVNSVSPGRVVSEQVDAVVHPGDAERAEFIAANIPAGRFGAPEECANVISFLASEQASYVTGEIIAVDGGMRRYAF